MQPFGATTRDVSFLSSLLLDTSTENIPLKSTLLPSTSDVKEKVNLRSESDIPPTLQTTNESKTRSSTDTHLVRSFDSGKLIFSIVVRRRIRTPWIGLRIRGWRLFRVRHHLVIRRIVRRGKIHCFRLKKSRRGLHHCRPTSLLLHGSWHGDQNG